MTCLSIDMEKPDTATANAKILMGSLLGKVESEQGLVPSRDQGSPGSDLPQGSAASQSAFADAALGLSERSQIPKCPASH